MKQKIQKCFKRADKIEQQNKDLPGKKNFSTNYEMKTVLNLIHFLILLLIYSRRDREDPSCGGTRAERNRLLQTTPKPDSLGEDAGGRGDVDVVYEPTSTIKELCQNVDAFIFVVDATVGKETSKI